MKLRIRSIATKETIRLTAPDASSLLDLKTLIAASLAVTSTNPNPIVPDSIHLSLNQTDELVASNATDPLSSLGLTSGDLLFFSFSPFRQTPANRNPVQAPNSVPPVSNLGTNSSSNNPIDNPNKETTVNPSPINLLAGPMEVDAGPAVLEESDNTHLIPGFVVELMEIKTEEDASILRRVVMLTHAAMLDVGFTVLNGAWPNLPHGWAFQASSLCLKYTISDIVNQVQALNEKVAVLKFSVLGNLVTIYGYVGGVNPDFYRFCFDLAKVATLFSLDLNSMNRKSEQEFMEIFRAVKDGVSLPLMIDLCLKNGLPLPPCFMFLSIDAKSKIMDLLPGTDVVRIGSTCKEMQNLSLDENLWRQKMEREFSNSLNDNTVMSAGTWRERYKRAYIAKKSALRFRPRQSNWFQSGRTARRIGSGRHFIIGGDADRFPAFGADLREAGPSVFRRLHGRQPSLSQSLNLASIKNLPESCRSVQFRIRHLKRNRSRIDAPRLIGRERRTGKESWRDLEASKSRREIQPKIRDLARIASAEVKCRFYLFHLRFTAERGDTIQRFGRLVELRQDGWQKHLSQL